MLTVSLAGVACLIIILILIAIPVIVTLSRFSPAPTGSITPDFLAVKDSFITVFILKSGDDLICFDAGTRLKGVEQGFKKLSLDPLNVKAVFLTHSDRDHVTGLPLFKNAAVYLSEKEEPLITGAAKRHFMFLGHANKLPVAEYKLLKENEIVRFGGSTVKAISTPGHTLGSTSYLINDRYLVVGDLAITKEGKLVGMPKPPSEDPKMIQESLRIVSNIKGIEYIATAHGGVVQNRSGLRRESIFPFGEPSSKRNAEPRRGGR